MPLKPYWTETKQQGPDSKEILTYQGREYLIMLAMGAALNFSLRPLPYEGWDSVSYSTFIFPLRYISLIIQFQCGVAVYDVSPPSNPVSYHSKVQVLPTIR